MIFRNKSQISVGMSSSSSSNRDQFQLGCAFKLVNLQSERGQQLNGRFGRILRENFNAEGELLNFRVRLIRTPDESSPTNILVKPMNLLPVCNQCGSEGYLSACIGCNQAKYCSAVCQKKHWDEHKNICRGRKATAKRTDETDEDIRKETDGKWNKAMDDPTWTKHLSLKQRMVMRRLHIAAECNYAWPVTGAETTAMLESKPPSFLMVHPNMRFRAMEVQIGPIGPKSLIVRETAPNENSDPERFERYSKLVPFHLPSIMQYCIVAKDVLWTQADYDDFRLTYEESSPLFNWPKEECVGVCPGTGKVVPFSNTSKHYLVACVLGGTVTGNDGTHFMHSRIMPRILTKKGLEQMVGNRGSKKRLISRTNGTEESQIDLDDVPLELVLDERPRRASYAFSEFEKQGMLQRLERTA